MTGSDASRVSSHLHNYPMRILSHGRPSMEIAGRSVTDMSLGGLQTPHRGFDFASEEGGVAIRRIQSNLSDRHEGRHRGLFPHLRKSVKKRIRFPSHRSVKSPEPSTS